MELPAGFSLMKRGRATIAVKDDCRDALSQLSLENLEEIADKNDHSAGYLGRELCTVITLDGLDERLVVRRCRRGGLLGKVVRELHLSLRGVARPFRELIVSQVALEKGLPTAQVMAAIGQQVLGPLYKGAVVSREIPGCVDLAEYLTSLKRPLLRDRLAEKRQVIRAVAEAVGTMHKVGLYHADLNARNILVQRQDRIRAYIIDLDKSRIAALSLSQRLRNLLRLTRSLEKLVTEGTITRTDRLRFFKAYNAMDEGWDVSTKACLARYTSYLNLYRIKWKLADALYSVMP